MLAISRSSAKKKDSLKMGADHFIATKEEPDWGEKYADTFDLIVVCATSLTAIDFDLLPTTMHVGGHIVSIAAPKNTEVLKLRPLGLMGVSISNRTIGSPKEIKMMLDLCVEKKLAIWVETLPISEKSVNEAFNRMEVGDVRYRFTFVDYEKQFA